jgi:hypothetical protein
MQSFEEVLKEHYSLEHAVDLILSWSSSMGIVPALKFWDAMWERFGYPQDVGEKAGAIAHKTFLSRVRVKPSLARAKGMLNDRERKEVKNALASGDCNALRRIWRYKKPYGPLNFNIWKAKQVPLLHSLGRDRRHNMWETTSRERKINHPPVKTRHCGKGCVVARWACYRDDGLKHWQESNVGVYSMSPTRKTKNHVVFAFDRESAMALAEKHFQVAA